MKRGCLTAMVVLALCVGAMVVGYNYKYPDYSYRYRLTVNIEVDGKVLHRIERDRSQVAWRPCCWGWRTIWSLSGKDKRHLSTLEIAASWWRR